MKVALTSFVVMLLVSFFGSAFAQNDTPGYLGKRFELYYNLSSNPALGTNQNMRNYAGTKSGAGEGALYFHARHDFGFQWATSRRSSLGMHFSGFRTGYVSGYYPYANNFQDTLGQLKVRGLGLAYRIYPFLKKGSIAPIGPFTQINYTVYQIGLFDPGVENGVAVVNKLIGVLGIYLGINSVLHDRILLNYGFELNRPFLNAPFSPVTTSRGDCCLERDLYNAISAHTNFNLRIGISGLLF